MKRSEIRRETRLSGKKKGFTLIEVLIVIVIIGALSGILMVSAVGAIDKAEATKIVSDLKNIQSASFLYFAEKSEWPTDDISLVNPYLSAELGADGNYSFINGEGTSVLALYHNSDISVNVMSKLKDMQDKGAPITVDIPGKSAAIAIRQ